VRDNLKFLVQICGITSLMLLVTLTIVTYLGNSQLAWGVFYGYLVSLVNILFGFYSTKWALDKPNNTFFTVILGGMGARFLFLLTALLTVWKFTRLPLAGFIASMVGFYLTLQFFEVRYIQKELNSRKVASSG